MAYTVSVEIVYDTPTGEEERSWDFTIETEGPFDIQVVNDLVASVADELVNPTFSPVPGGQPPPFTYTWRLQSVFEF